MYPHWQLLCLYFPPCKCRHQHSLVWYHSAPVQTSLASLVLLHHYSVEDHHQMSKWTWRAQPLSRTGRGIGQESQLSPEGSEKGLSLFLDLYKLNKAKINCTACNYTQCTVWEVIKYYWWKNNIMVTNLVASIYNFLVTTCNVHVHPWITH